MIETKLNLKMSELFSVEINLKELKKNFYLNILGLTKTSS